MSSDSTTEVTLAQVLNESRKRDPHALESPDHLRALLADLAPTLPSGLLRACGVAANAKLTNFLADNPGTSAAEAARWLVARDPDLGRGDAKQVAEAYAAVLAAQQSTVWRNESGPTTSGEPTVWASATVPPPHRDSARASRNAADSWAASGPSTDLPSFGVVTRKRPKRRPLIIAASVVAILAIGIVAYLVAFNRHPKSPTARTPVTPGQVTGVRAMPDGAGVMVQFRPVTGAQMYHIQDTTGGLTLTDTPRTTYTFTTGGNKPHTFRVAAMAGSRTGKWSVPAMYMPPGMHQSGKPLPAPSGVMADHPLGTLSVHLMWGAVQGATRYRITDNADPKAPALYAPAEAAPMLDIPYSVYTMHEWVVQAMNGDMAGARSKPMMWPMSPFQALSMDDAAIAYQIPIKTVISAYCVHATPVGGATGAVSCQPRGRMRQGPAHVLGLQFSSASALADFLSAYRSSQAHHGDCSSHQPAGGVSGTSPYPYACRIDHGVARIVWTYPGTSVALVAEGGFPTDMSAEYSWWKRYAAPLNKVPGEK